MLRLPLPANETDGASTPFRRYTCRWGLAALFLVLAGGLLSPTKAQTFSREKGIAGPCTVCKVDVARPVDLDSDGDKDVVVGSLFPYIGWFENTDSGFSEFKRINKEPGGGGLHANVISVELSGDKKPDLMTGSTWFENQGGGAFSESKYVTGQDQPKKISRAADFVGDSREDVVMTLGGDLVLFENGNFGNSANARTIADFENSLVHRSLELADVDGDGDPDILESHGQLVNGFDVRWFENLDDGGFGAGQVFASTGQYGDYYSSIRTADLDGDRDLDVLTPRSSASGLPGTLAWHENVDGVDSLGRGQIIAKDALPSVNDARPIDLDGDGDQDIATSAANWFENEGGGTFSSKKSLAPSGGQPPIETGDLNGDGRKDVIYPRSRKRAVHWYPNLKEGLLGARRTLGKELAVPNPFVVETADVNVDGRPDLIVRTGFGLGRSADWLKNTGSGFVPAETITEAPVSGTRTVVAQIDGNQGPDIAWVREDSTSTKTPTPELLEWGQNDGTGGFTINGFGNSSQYGFATATADVDGDGDQDFLVGLGTDDLAVYPNEGGTLKGGTSYRTLLGSPYDPEQLRPADLDGDGDRDLVTSTDGRIDWFEDTGNDWVFGDSGQDDFSNAKSIDSSTSTDNQVRAVDVDSDRDLDLVAYEGIRTKWYENTDGEGTFSDAKTLDISPIVRRVMGNNIRFADVDGDSDPDVLTFDGPYSNSTYVENAWRDVDYGSRKIWWHENQGGTFTSRTALIDGADRPRELHVFDLNNDGSMDVGYRSEDYQKIAWYRNESTVVARRSMAAGETASFSEASTEIALSSSTQGSGTVTVRRPFSGPVGRDGLGDASIVGDYRLVVDNGTSLSVGSGSELRIDAASIPGLHQPAKATVFVRDTVDRGAFQPVQTTYNSGTDRLVATTGQFGEMVVATTADKAAPDVPTALSARASADSVALAWTPVDSADVTTYRIYRSTAPIDSAAGPSTLAALDTVAAPATAYTDGTIQPDTTYHYRVTAVDDNLNESGYSGAVQTTPHPVRIASVRPRHGAPGTPVRIYGAGFALHASDVSVTIGGVAAPIDRVTASSILARVPDQAGGRVEISVTSGGTSILATPRFGVVTGGNGAFSSSPLVLSGVKRINALDAADYDGDGDLDVALIGKDTTDAATTGIYQNQGDGTFERAGAGLPNHGFGSLTWADYDSDGDPDLLIRSPKDIEFETVLYENQGESSFKPAGVDLSGGRTPHWADYDGDGDLDLLKQGYRFYQNQGDGTFDPVDLSKVGLTATGALDWADFDGDGDLDAAVVGTDANRNRTTTVFENNGDGTFSPLGANLTDLDRGGVSWGDYDRDGDPDLVIAGESGSGKETILYENQGDGTFAKVGAGLTDVGRAVPALSWGDYDGDGAPDLFLTGENANSDVVAKIFRNRDGTTFEPFGVEFKGIADISRGWSGDFGGDGDLDLILSGEDDSFTEKALLFENGRSLATRHTATVGSDGTVDFGNTGVAIDFSGVGGTGKVTVSKYRNAPTDPKGISESNVGSYRFVINAGDDLTFKSGTTLRLAVGTLGGIGDPADVTIYKRDPAGRGSFQALQTTVGTNGTPNTPSDDTLYAAINSFSEFALASNSEPLPVELVRFEGKTVESGVRLTWKTASETRNAGFKVQRKTEEDGGWQSLGYKDGMGTASESQSYRFVDTNLPFEADSLTYRLKQLDTDGSVSYSAKVTVERGVEHVRLLGTYPNPARRQATVRYALPEKQETTIRLYDVLGRKVRTIVRGPQSGRHQTTVDVSDLPSGTYFLRLRAGGKTATERMTVVR